MSAIKPVERRPLPWSTNRRAAIPNLYPIYGDGVHGSNVKHPAPVFVEPGDILFFSGTFITSRLIRTATASPYSHSAICVFLGDVPHCLEVSSQDTLTAIPDALLGVPKKGVQLVPLLVKIKQSYDGFAIRRPSVPYTDDHMQRIDHFYRVLHASVRGFETSISILVDALRPMVPTTTSPSRTKMFCSELVALWLKSIGLINRSYRAREFSPEELSRMTLANSSLEYTTLEEYEFRDE